MTTAAILLALAAIGLATNQPVLLAPFAASAVAIAMTPLAAGAAPRIVLLAYLIAMASGVMVLVPVALGTVVLVALAGVARRLASTS